MPTITLFPAYISTYKVAKFKDITRHLLSGNDITEHFFYPFAQRQLTMYIRFEFSRGRPDYEDIHFLMGNLCKCKPNNVAPGNHHTKAENVFVKIYFHDIIIGM